MQTQSKRMKDRNAKTVSLDRCIEQLLAPSGLPSKSSSVALKSISTPTIIKSVPMHRKKKFSFIDGLVLKEKRVPIPNTKQEEIVQFNTTRTIENTPVCKFEMRNLQEKEEEKEIDNDGTWSPDKICGDIQQETVKREEKTEMDQTWPKTESLPKSIPIGQYAQVEDVLDYLFNTIAISDPDSAIQLLHYLYNTEIAKLVNWIADQHRNLNFANIRLLNKLVFQMDRLWIPLSGGEECASVLRSLCQLLLCELTHLCKLEQIV